MIRLAGSKDKPSNVDGGEIFFADPAFQNAALDFVGQLADAENAAEEIIDDILTLGGQQLYEAYINRKSFPFASETISTIIQSELRLCFVRHDLGECTTGSHTDDWSLEPEPPRCRIDTWVKHRRGTSWISGPVQWKTCTCWLCFSSSIRTNSSSRCFSRTSVGFPSKARSCVPVRRKFVRSPSVVRTSRWPKPSNSTPSKGVITPQVESEVKPVFKPIPLVEERHEDAEESMLRDMMDREARRKRDEETTLLRKAADAEGVARITKTQFKGQQSKPFFHDSSGNIHWVDPVNLTKLPLTMQVPHASVVDAEQAEFPRERRTTSEPRERPPPPRQNCPDSYEPLESKQPAMIEAMSMAPGVVLSERGQTLTGGPSKLMHREGMTRKSYQELVKLGGHVPGDEESRASLVNLAPSDRSASVAGSRGEGQGDEERIPSDIAAEAVTSAHPTPTPPRILLSGRRVPYKGAVAMTMSARVRQPAASHPLPPLGAIRKKREIDRESFKMRSASPPKARSGHIVRVNPKLAHHLFPSQPSL